MRCYHHFLRLFQLRAVPLRRFPTPCCLGSSDRATRPTPRSATTAQRASCRGLTPSSDACSTGSGRGLRSPAQVSTPCYFWYYDSDTATVCSLMICVPKYTLRHFGWWEYSPAFANSSHLNVFHRTPRTSKTGRSVSVDFQSWKCMGGMLGSILTLLYSCYTFYHETDFFWSSVAPVQ